MNGIRQWLVLALMFISASASAAESSTNETKLFSLSEPVIHTGCCDASAGVAVSSNLFIVADDEDSFLRVYQRDQPGKPVQIFSAGPFLHLDPRKPETDLEAATRVGDRIYWITSHGRNRKGDARESRHRFFATTFHVSDAGRVELRSVGMPYTRLLDDFVRDRRLAKFNLLGASLLAPKEPGALNIEGLCATTNGELLIGFRNPIPNEHALVLPLKNPAELLEGKPAKFGDPILLDLDELGVRDMALVGDHIMIIAGPFDGKGHFHLYDWDGRSTEPHRIPATHFRDMTPEALVVYPGAPPNEFQILSDDGTRKVAGQDCKRLTDRTQKTFRSYWARID